jgi:hypothetical protein
LRASAVNGYCRLSKWETSETEEKIVEQDQRATGTGTEGAGGSFDSAVNALSMNTLNATSKNLRAIAGEILEISKQSFELTMKTLEKLRTAHGVDEVAAIQADFMKEPFEHAAHGRKFGELVAAFPAEITKTYQEAWLKSVSAATKATEKPN